MSFRITTEMFIEEEECSRDMAVALHYLLTNAVGVKNAKTGSQIERALAERGVKMDKHKFQTKVLRRSREANSGFFIGSSRDGFFIIDTPEDFKAADDYCTSRIEAQITNREYLRNQAAQHGL